MLLDNDKVQLFEVHFKPGAVNAAVPRQARVVRALTSGTLERADADGRKQNIAWKAGEVRFNPAEAADAPVYTVRNIGAKARVLDRVVLK